MANPHQAYAHPGPSYYHSAPPPPPYPYNPGPAVPYYPYHMNSLSGQSPPPHQPASPRANGIGRGGYYPHRAGGPGYQHFPHVPHQHYLQTQPISPTSAHPLNAYPHPPQKFSPHLQHMPYSQQSYHPPTNGPNSQYSSSSWTTQTLSPLPKQLSMPAQLPSPLPLGEDSPAPPPRQPIQAEPIPQPIPESPRFRAPSPSLSAQDSSEPLPPNSLPLQPPSPSPSVPSEVSEPAPIEHIVRPSTPRSPEASKSSITLSSSGIAYVVWSRKPRRPSRAVGVMIASSARPPSHVLEGAVDLRTPPPSPKAKVLKTTESVAVASNEHEVLKDPSQSTSDTTEIPSSSATEATTNSTAPVTPNAGSPSSANTSVTSAAPSPAQHPKVLEPVPKVEPLEEVNVAGPRGSSSIQSQAEVSSSTGEPAAIAEPSQAPAAKSSVPPPKKSWASLLQPGDASGSSKSRLPTSAIVGFSIPAGVGNGAPSASTAKGLANSIRPEVLNLLNVGPSGPSIPPKIRPRGLINTGNMCFANAVLQVLVYCPPFWRLFTELGKLTSSHAQHQNNTTATPLVDAVIQFLKEFGVKEVEENRFPRSKGKEREEDFDDLDSFIPTNVYDVMKEKKRFANMVGGHQEDAEEFLGFFLDTLEEELLSLTAAPSKVADEPEATSGDGWLEVQKKNRAAITRATKATESPITRMFGGKFKSILKAPHQRDSITVEDWRSLRLDIQRDSVSTIKDALQHISDPHSVEISSPTRPGVVIEASRQELIESLPPILILHLKRFLYDTSVGDVVKLGKHVTFGPELEIGPDLQARRPAQPVKYQLIGALYHHGQSASGGHYTLDVLHPNRDLSDRPRPAWIRIDDELVSDVHAEDVFGGQERDDRCAYLLFYRRLGPGIPIKTWSQTAK